MRDDDKPVTQSDFGALVERVAALEKTSQANTEGIVYIRKNTDQLVGAFRAAQGAFTVLEFMGRMAKPVLAIMAFFGAVVLFIKYGEWPR